jgi:hypothetical protein
LAVSGRRRRGRRCAANSRRHNVSDFDASGAAVCIAVAASERTDLAAVVESLEDRSVTSGRAAGGSDVGEAWFAVPAVVSVGLAREAGRGAVAGACNGIYHFIVVATRAERGRRTCLTVRSAVGTAVRTPEAINTRWTGIGVLGIASCAVGFAALPSFDCVPVVTGLTGKGVSDAGLASKHGASAASVQRRQSVRAFQAIGVVEGRADGAVWLDCWRTRSVGETELMLASGADGTGGGGALEAVGRTGDAVVAEPNEPRLALGTGRGGRRGAGVAVDVAAGAGARAGDHELARGAGEAGAGSFGALSAVGGGAGGAG